MHNINIELGKGINGLLLILIGVVHVAGSRAVAWVGLQSGINVGTTIAGFVALMAASQLPWAAGQNRQSSALSSSLTSSTSLSGYQEHHLLDLYHDPWLLHFRTGSSFLLYLFFLVQPPSFKGMTVLGLGDSLEGWRVASTWLPLFPHELFIFI